MVVFPDFAAKYETIRHLFGERRARLSHYKLGNGPVIRFVSATVRSELCSFAADVLVFVDCREIGSEARDMCMNRIQSSKYRIVENWNNGILSGNPDIDRLTVLISQGIISVNEARQILGLPKIESGDNFLRREPETCKYQVIKNKVISLISKIV